MIWDDLHSGTGWRHTCNLDLPYYASPNSALRHPLNYWPAIFQVVSLG